MKTSGVALLRDAVTPFGVQRIGDAPISGRKKLLRRGLSQNDGGTKHRVGGGRRSDGLDLPSAHEALCTSRVTREGPGACDVHVIVKEMQDAMAFNERVVNSPKAERGSPHVWFFNAMVKATVKILAQKTQSGGVSFPDQGKGRGNKDDQNNYREFDVRRTESVVKSMQASRQLAQNPGNHPKSRIMEEAGSRQSTSSFCAAGGGHGSARRVPKEEDEHPGPDPRGGTVVHGVLDITSGLSSVSYVWFRHNMVQHM